MVIRNSRELGRLIRERRKQHRLTQAQLATIVGASRKWIIDLESGKRTAELSLTLRTLNTLGLQVDVKQRSESRSPGSARINEILEAAKKN
jgi:y4mF family transcriptional regulator